MIRWQGLNDNIVWASNVKYDVETNYENHFYKNNLSNIRYVKIENQGHSINKEGYAMFKKFLSSPKSAAGSGIMNERGEKREARSTELRKLMIVTALGMSIIMI